MKLLSIGAVSQACGVPIDTLRTWERRYHFPAPQRTPGGQRLYFPDTVDRLIAVTQAIANGVQVSRAIQFATSRDESAPPPSDDRTDWLERWLDLVVALDVDALDQAFRREHGLLGTMRFLNERGGRFLEALGEGWADGRISVANEHFASERFREFLVGIWGPIAAENTGPTVICATLPGEGHQLGLHMAAATVALAGLRVLFLGANMPPQDTAQALRKSGGLAIVVSISDAIELPTVRRQLRELRLAVGEGVAIVVGGRGAPVAEVSVIAPGGFDGLAVWAKTLFKR